MVYLKKKDDVKENKVEINTTHEPHKNTKDSVKEPKQIQKDTSSKETKNTLKETAVSGQHSSKESKRIKKKNDILSQIGKALINFMQCSTNKRNYETGIWWISYFFKVTR